MERESSHAVGDLVPPGAQLYVRSKSCPFQSRGPQAGDSRPVGGKQKLFTVFQRNWKDQEGLQEDFII